MKYFIINWWLDDELCEQELIEAYTYGTVRDYAQGKSINDPENYGEYEVIEVSIKQIV
jgi:hypothetical protein